MADEKSATKHNEAQSEGKKESTVTEESLGKSSATNAQSQEEATAEKLKEKDATGCKTTIPYTL